MKSASLAAALLAAALAAPALADAPVVRQADGVLVDARGMTVYTFDKDLPGKSTCTGRCADAWPPVLASNAPVTPPYSVITRADGKKQLAYNGKPLYTYEKDRKPGDRKGDRVNNAWHIVGAD